MLVGARRTRGFSLVELLVTLALLAFLLLLGLPAFSTMVKNTQVRTVAEGLQNGVRLARTEALRQNRLTVFSLTNAAPAVGATAVAGGMNWSIQTVPIAGSGTDDPAAFVQGGALGDVASGVAIAGSTSTGSVNALCFNSNGRLAAPAALASPPNASCAAQPVVFTVRHPKADRGLNVTVAIGGQVRICDPARLLSTTAPDGCPP